MISSSVIVESIFSQQFQYSSVIISVRRETVRLKANNSSSPVKILLLAISLVWKEKKDKVGILIRYVIQ